MNETKEPDPHLFWLLLSHTKLVQIFEDMRWSLPISHRKSSFQWIKKLVWNEYYLCVRIMQFRHPLLFFIFLKYWLLWNRYYRLVEQYVNYGKGWRSLLRFDYYLVLPSSSTALWYILENSWNSQHFEQDAILVTSFFKCYWAASNFKVGEKCQACKSHNICFVNVSRKTYGTDVTALTSCPGRKVLANPTRQLHEAPAHRTRRDNNQLAERRFLVARASLASVRPMSDTLHTQS